MNTNTLATVLQERRAELRRYFAARVGDADADDLLQEVWLRVSRLEDAARAVSPQAYLYRLATNVMLDRLRYERSRSRRDGDWLAATRMRTSAGDDVSEEPTAERSVIARDRLARVGAALAELPEPVQLTFRLHKLEGLTHGQVASRLGVSRSLVEKHMMRALRHLVERAGR